jgi:hypothetical protein
LKIFLAIRSSMIDDTLLASRAITFV